MRFVVIVTGSRDWPRPEQVIDDLWALLKDPEVDVLVVKHGKHWEGADLAARAFCREAEPLAVFLGKEVIERPYPAAWTVRGKRAGPERNTEMVDSGAHGYLSYRLNGELSRGTTDCIGKLKVAEIFPLVSRELSTLPGALVGP